MQPVRLGVILAVAVASFQLSDCWLFDGILGTFRSLTSVADRTVRNVAEPFVQVTNIGYQSGREMMETAEDIPVVGDMIVGVQDVIDAGREAVASGVSIAVGAIEQTCAPLRVLTATYMLFSKDANELENLRVSLVTPSGQEDYTIASAPTAILNSRHYDPSLKTVLFIHGFTDDPRSWSFSSISSAFQQLGGYNILALDSSSLLRIFYTRATMTVKYIGRRLAKMIVNLVSDGVPLDDILLVGHSLGAHIAAHTGRSFRRATGTKLPRISSLDPAGPCFSGAAGDEELQLTSDDADFVDVMHTNTGVAGLSQPFGHADFYVNGGATQPGCSEALCDHVRAFEYYAESVLNPDAFVGLECDSWQHFLRGQCADGNMARMGFPADTNTSGIFFLKTSRRSPFGLGLRGVNL